MRNVSCTAERTAERRQWRGARKNKTDVRVALGKPHVKNTSLSYCPIAKTTKIRSLKNSDSKREKCRLRIVRMCSPPTSQNLKSPIPSTTADCIENMKSKFYSRNETVTAFTPADSFRNMHVQWTWLHHTQFVAWMAQAAASKQQQEFAAKTYMHRSTQCCGVVRSKSTVFDGFKFSSRS